MNYKKGFSVIELIFSLLIMGILITVCMGLFYNIHQVHEEEYQHEILKLELLNTQYFLEKNLNSSHTLIYKKNHLFFHHRLLLKHVSTFKIKHQNENFFIDICLQNKLCKHWVIVP